EAHLQYSGRPVTLSQRPTARCCASSTRTTFSPGIRLALLLTNGPTSLLCFPKPIVRIEEQMKTKLKLFFIIAVVIILPNTAHSQIRLRKFEIGVQFSAMSLQDPDVLVHDAIGDPGFIGVARGTGQRTEPGIGGRLTYNATSSLALEAETSIFSRPPFDLAKPSGRGFKGQFGAKVGKRFAKFGIFGKARPGFVRFAEVTKLLSKTTTTPAGPLNQVFTVGTFGRGSALYFSADVGTVVEYYVAEKAFIR